MDNIHVDNINIEEIKKATDQGAKYKLKRFLASSLAVMTMLPFMATFDGNGSAHAEDISSSTGITYFTEDQMSKDHIRLGSNLVNESLEELKLFGERIRVVDITDCYNIDDMSLLATYCPNIEELHLNYSPSISDLSFIYSLPNLRKVDIKENGYVTPELVNYLDKHGIEHNITQEDLDNVKELDQVISEIITDDMTDEEKIQAITYYVIDNYHYKITKIVESNDRPLSSTLENRGGVCASYAYLANILYKKAGIKSYEVVTNRLLLGHGWNLVELDGKYYYIDTTNIKQIPFISKLVLKHFNIGFYYMTDPRATGLSPMVDFDKVKKITISEAMIEDIERGESEKTIIEKYGNSVPVRIIEIVLILAAATTGMSLACKGIEAIEDTISARKRAKREEERRREEERKRREREEQRRRGYY